MLRPDEFTGRFPNLENLSGINAWQERGINDADFHCVKFVQVGKAPPTAPCATAKAARCRVALVACAKASAREH